MADSEKPHDGTPLVADDMIGSLATRVRELSLRVAELQGELEAARRRIAVYEDFDSQVQDALAAALRAASQVRERARVSAEAIAAEARAQRPPSATELDALRTERDTLRRAIDDSLQPGARRPAAPPAPAPFPMAEMRSAAADALRGVFKELVAEMRASTPTTQTAVTPAAASAIAAPQPEAQPDSPPPSSSDATEPEAPMPRPTLVAPQPSAVVEDEEIAEASATPAPAAAPSPTPQPAAAEPAREEWITAPSEAIGEVQVVLSPVSSFPRLVELERRLQGLPVVRTVYARDFRNGVATLAIGLRHPMTVDEFATAVTTLEYPRLRIVSTSGYVLELRIDSEASSIA